MYNNISNQTATLIRQLSQKKYREENGLFLTEGTKIVNEFLNEGIKPIKIIIRNDKRTIIPQISYYQRMPDLIELADEVTFNKLSSFSTPSGVMAIFPIPELNPFDVSQSVVLYLDRINDPGNFGTIIRIADWYGMRQIMCSPDCVDIYNPKTISATMGSLVRVKAYETNISSLIEEGYPLYISSLEGEENIWDQRIQKGVIIIGSEAHGVSEEILLLPHQKIKIPQIGGAESLNVAVATGIICDNIVRQNKDPEK